MTILPIMPQLEHELWEAAIAATEAAVLSLGRFPSNPSAHDREADATEAAEYVLRPRLAKVVRSRGVRNMLVSALGRECVAKAAQLLAERGGVNDNQAVPL